MSDTTADIDTPPNKGSKLPMILGGVLALAGAAGGFYATWSGMILAPESGGDSAGNRPNIATLEVAYVAVDPLVVSLRAPAQSQHLKFRAHLEVPLSAQANVEKLLPRVTDVLNSYLRAVEPGDLEDPSALTRLRAQMLRRVQVVAGAGMINDLLIMEFVLN